MRAPLSTISTSFLDKAKPNATDLAIDIYEQIIEVAGLLRIDEQLLYKQMRQQR